MYQIVNSLFQVINALRAFKDKRLKITIIIMIIINCCDKKIRLFLSVISAAEESNVFFFLLFSFVFSSFQ